MTKSPSSPAAEVFPLEPGRVVRTPMGNMVTVRAIRSMADHVEVKVEYAEGEFAWFRPQFLRPLP